MFFGTKIYMLYWRNNIKSGCATAGFHCIWWKTSELKPLYNLDSKNPNSNSRPHLCGCFLYKTKLSNSTNDFVTFFRMCEKWLSLLSSRISHVKQAPLPGSFPLHSAEWWSELYFGQWQSRDLSPWQQWADFAGAKRNGAGEGTNRIRLRGRLTQKKSH